MKLEIVIACDHAGFHMKEYVMQNLSSDRISFIDCGCFNPQDVDYPDYALKAVQTMHEDSNRLGILICATGIGMNIFANRYNFIRAFRCSNTDDVRCARMHNDINVLCLGARIIAPIYSIQLIETFLNTEFSKGRHQKRIDKLTNPKTIEENLKVN